MNQEEINGKPATKKLKIPTEEWHTYNSNIRLSKTELNKLIMNFFIVEGYKDAAVLFMQETGTKVSQEEIESMTDRIEVKRLILDGRIDAAIEKLESTHPEILLNDTRSLFTLKLQKLIEYIKVGAVEQAIEFAQTELVPLVEREVEKAMTLLAFDDVSQCPVNELVENQQRLKVSSEVNTALLKQQHNAQDAKISILMKLLLWSQNTLAQQVEFPELADLANGRFKSDEEKVVPNTEID